MILLAKRQQLRDLLLKVLERRWGVGKTRPLVYVPSLDRLLKEEASPRARFLVLDLGTCCERRNAAPPLADWYRQRQWLQPVLVLSADAPEQLYLYDSFKSVFPWAVLLHDSHFNSDPHWDEIHRRGIARQFAGEIGEELVEAGLASELIVEIVRAAPRSGHVKELCQILQRSRFTLHRELALPPKELLDRARLLWAAKLHAHGWSHATLALYLGYQTAWDLRRQLLRSRESLDEFLRVPYAARLQDFVEYCTAQI